MGNPSSPPTEEQVFLAPFPLTQHNCEAINLARWSKLILLPKSSTGWESWTDFPRQHTHQRQDKRSNRKVWLGLGNRQKENRAGPLFLAAVQFSKIKRNMSLHSSYNPRTSRKKKCKEAEGYAVSQGEYDNFNYLQNKLEHPTPAHHIW